MTDSEPLYQRGSSQSEQDFGAAVIDTIAALIVVLDRQGRIMRYNRVCERVTGYTYAEVHGRYIWDLFLLPEEVPAIRNVFAQLLDGQFPNEFENYWVTKSGKRRLIAWTNTAICDQQGRVVYVIGTGIDVTEARLAEQSRRESEQLYSSLFKNNHAVMLLIDPQTGQIVDANPAACSFYGYASEEWAGLKITDLNTLTQEQVFEEMRRAQTETRRHFLFRHRLSSGEVRDVEVYSGPIQFGGRSLLYSIIHDITERRKAEQAVQVSLQQLERANQELQDFAYISSHDMQEPLRKIQSFADRLEAKYSQVLDEPGRDYLERMKKAAQRMQGMIQDLLAYSRVTTQAKPFEPVNLTAVVAEVLSDLEVRMEQSRGVVQVAELPVIDADPVQMSLLFQNLISNALKFHRPGVPPQVYIRVGERSGEMVQILVEDNGVGFDLQHLDRIFQPFQRLVGRSQYEGTGIGLAICRKIVDRHGGSITAQSTPGKGSVFILTLPQHPG